MPERWPEALKRRYVGVGKNVMRSLSIERGNKKARNRYYADMFNLFGAPCLILACVDQRLVIEYAMLDIGLISQTICLLAYERGLGTCILAAAVRYPVIIRQVVPIPTSKVLVIGTAVGYPDWDSPINSFERERAGVDEVVNWVR
jgi:nitroreductase